MHDVATERAERGKQLTIEAKFMPVTAMKFWQEPVASPSDDISLPGAR